MRRVCGGMQRARRAAVLGRRLFFCCCVLVLFVSLFSHAMCFPIHDIMHWAQLGERESTAQFGPDAEVREGTCRGASDSPDVCSSALPACSLP